MNSKGQGKTTTKKQISEKDFINYSLVQLFKHNQILIRMK